MLVVLWLAIWAAVLPVDGVEVDLTYILKREKSKVRPSCIAEGLERYDAVGWVYPMPADGTGIPNITTKFVPALHNDFNCKFSKNDLCNIRWSIKDWYIDESSPRTRQFIGDLRWEDLPTLFVSNSSKEFEHRFHVEKAARIGFSVRASGKIEIFLCSGWNPRNYPCYYFAVTEREIFLYKYSTLPKTIEEPHPSTSLDSFKAFSNVLADDEWRNFEVSVDEGGTVSLVDKNLNRALIKYNDSEPLQAMYFLMRSQEPSLWKISENQFMYTKTAQISRMGPQLFTTYKDLCVSVLVSTCDRCALTFFRLNGTSKKILNRVAPTDERWIEIKLKEEKIDTEKINIFVQTHFDDEKLERAEGFWAIDNVRVCNENEVKVSFLKVNQDFEEDDLSVDTISCQMVSKPNWRPVRLDYDEIKEFPPVKTVSNQSTITLSWQQEDPDNLISYFIFYQGNDICRSSETTNSERVKSSGFLVTKNNQFTVRDLVPFTAYNITISSVLHENDRQLVVSTIQTDEPTFEEVPFNIRVRPLDAAVNVTWDKPGCASTYGRLIYNLAVVDRSNRTQKSIEMQTDNSYLIRGLEAYTPYTLTVTTARNARNLVKGVHLYNVSVNFTTLPGVADEVVNLEVYAIGTKVAYLRYDLPESARGVPEEVQVRRCNALSFAKCRSSVSKIERCRLWRKKFCVDVNYLMPHQQYVFKVSVKNVDTNAFGKEAEINGHTVDRVPGAPENITYRIVDCHSTTDYCHLNISWFHPSYPNGTITSFQIVLNGTNYNYTDSEEDEAIHEIYKIVNETYLPQYTYQIKYVPYSTTYNLYIRSSNNKYRSAYSTATVKTADIGDHIDQSPKLLGKSDKALVFKLPHLDRRLNSYTVTVAVQDYNVSKAIDLETIANSKVADNLCHSFGDTWIVGNLTIANNNNKTLTISGVDEDHKIKPHTKYCVIFIITNNYREEEHDVVYYEKLETPEEPEPKDDVLPASSSSRLYWLLLLLLLIPIGFVIYRYVRRRRITARKRDALENVYESLPFEENFTNRTYDQLIHK
ncbi:uncharacterized protein LOC132706804 [Cylas formicarius]|uniref:uncharacterized protein LOC132706804 n=1 Tax=Cylas formicarius TaxID=197179 RepID=UPI002958A99E|nr:uncharacterized protein LOC132706804 [Cylas formicarius]